MDEKVAVISVNPARARRRPPAHSLPIGSPCPNCATVLQGPWCHACGQVAEDYHRSAAKLLVEAAESFTHMDGRFWQTLPKLVLRPASLTRAYIEGHRAVQIPPLRLFLVVLLIFFFVGSLTGYGEIGRGIRAGWNEPSVASSHGKPVEHGAVAGGIDNARVTVGGKTSGATNQWLRERGRRAMANPETFLLILEQWSERFVFMMLPIAALILSLTFAFSRRFYVFDHVIFALHSLSFQGLLLSVLTIVDSLGSWTDWPVLAVMALASPTHLFVHMRGVYGSSVAGTIIRMVILGIGSLLGFALLMVGLVLVGLHGVGAA